MSEALYQALKALEGTESEPRPGNDRVNEAMIRHWCEAMQDSNPAYTGRGYAAAGPYNGIIAPPTMVQAYCTPPLWPQAEARPDPIFRAVRTCVEAGYSASLGVSMSYEFLEALRPGDALTFRVKLLSVTRPKTTRAGTGHFLAAQYSYFNHTGTLVCRQVLTVFQYLPGGSDRGGG